MDDIAHAPNPCLPAATEGMTGEMLRGWQAMLAMKADECGPVPPRAFFDRASGEQLTDSEILRRVFNGHSPAVIPAPAAVWAFLAALGALAMVGRRK